MEKPAARRVPFNQRLSTWVVIFIAALGINATKFYYAFFSKNNNPLPTLVVAAPATTQEVPVYLSALGTVIPTYNVTVRTQINGTLLKVFFTEGQMVKK